MTVTEQTSSSSNYIVTTNLYRDVHKGSAPNFSPLPPKRAGSTPTVMLPGSGWLPTSVTSSICSKATPARGHGDTAGPAGPPSRPRGQDRG